MPEKPIKLGDTEIGTWFYECDGPVNDTTLDLTAAFEGEIDVTGVKKVLGKLGQLIPDKKAQDVVDQLKEYAPSGSISVLLIFKVTTATTLCVGAPSHARRLSYEVILFVRVKLEGGTGVVKGKATAEFTVVLARDSVICTCPQATKTSYLMPSTPSGYLVSIPGGVDVAAVFATTPTGSQMVTGTLQSQPQPGSQMVTGTLQPQPPGQVQRPTTGGGTVQG